MAGNIWYTGTFRMRNSELLLSPASSLLCPFPSRFLFPLSYVICLGGVFSLLSVLPCHLFSFVRDEQFLHWGTLKWMNDRIYAIWCSRNFGYFGLWYYPGFLTFYFPGALQTAVVFFWCVQWLILRHMVWEMALLKHLIFAFFLDVSDVFPSLRPSCLERN